MLRLVVNSLLFLGATFGLGMLGVAVMRRQRSRIARLLTGAGMCAAISLGLTGIIAEVAARFVRDVPIVLRRYYFQEYRPGWFALEQNATLEIPSVDPSQPAVIAKTNEDGLRTQVHRATEEAAERERRVMFFGDSFTFGLGLPDEDTIPAQAERILNEGNTGLPWVSVNAGIPGYNVLSSIELFDWLVDHYKPEVVVFTVGEVDDIGPDLGDRWRAGEKSIAAPSLERFALYRYFSYGRDWARYSANYTFGRDGWDVRWNVLESQLSRLAGSIEKMKAAAERSKVRLVVNVLMEPRTSSEGPMQPKRLAPMAAFATELCTVWDRTRVEEIIPGDGHPNQRGARRLAEAVVPHIRTPTAIGLVK